jgi:hypothetical protein
MFIEKKLRTLIRAILLLIILSFAFNITNAGGKQVNVFYYPWYDTTRHWQEGYLRSILVPPQPPQLGQYSSRNNSVINQHITWSETYEISNWICSWWGPGSWEDITIENNIAPLLAGHNVTYCIFYESASLLNLQNNQINFDSSTTATFVSHIHYIASTYFSDPKYLKINGRPVIYLYLSRCFTGSYKAALQQIRQDVQTLGYNIYIVGDEVYWGTPDTARIATLDAITTYNMHGPANYAGYPSQTNFISDVYNQFVLYKTAATSKGVTFIPGTNPGFNDRGVRLSANHPVISDQFQQDSSYTSTLSHYADAVLGLIDPTINSVCVTSFNEWHEDTQIEPSIVSSPTNNDGTPDYEYTQGYYYKGYGTDYLQVIKDKFGSTTGITVQNNLPKSFALNQNYPNPFNPSTAISYRLSAVSQTTLKVYNVLGEEVATLVNGVQQAGEHTVNFNATNLTSGIYLYKLQAGNFVETKKMILMK